MQAIHDKVRLGTHKGKSVRVEIEIMIVTKAAEQHFRDLISKEETPGMNLRIYVAHPGTPHAEIGLTFCPPGEEEKSDVPMHFNEFQLLVAEDSSAALKEARIDFLEDAFGGQLSIKAPGLRGQSPAPDAALEDRIKYVLEAEISPTLAGHGGRVALVEIIEEPEEEGKIVILQFGGGCHGCGMANVTLKNGIEKTLKEKFPEIKEVRDVTDHASGANPYYTSAESC